MSARNRTLGFERDLALRFVARHPRNEMREIDAEVLLVGRARAGDRDAYDVLVRGHFERVYTLMFRMTKNHEDAEDLAQEAFVRAWGALASYREEASFSTWVQRIGVHLAIAHQKQKSRRGLDRALDDAAFLVETRETGSGNELAAAVSHALDELPPRLRAAIVLRSLEEREYEDMARILGVRPATARTHVMQARKLIMRWLAPWFEGGRR
jgi:RNA polymerase sigma-70 factor (ECF subfamily)